MFSHGLSRPSQACKLLTFESLEKRRLLAGDLRVGDANEDYYFDEADWVQVWKAGKYETGEAASWNEGDWNEDGIFTRDDILAAFGTTNRGRYRLGPYDDEAKVPINQLGPLAVDGEADTTVFYFPATGKVTVVAPSDSKLTAVHLVSKSNSFSGYRGNGPIFNRRSSMFDVASPGSQFVMTLPVSWIEHQDLLPLGWTPQQVIDDLLVDGALLGGGGLGNVRLGLLSDFPDEQPEDVWITEPEVLPTFVGLDEANGLLTYDPQTGDILIEAIDVTIFSVKLLSPDGLFTGATQARHDDLVPHSLDYANPTEFGRIALDAIDPFNIFEIPEMTSIFLPGIARTGLSANEVTAGIHPWGLVNSETDFLNLALEIGPLFTECETHLADGVMLGDANLDGQFNSQDLVAVFQPGEYDDGIPSNSTWNEGDWTCDGDFDSSDLVAAFQAGNYELAAARGGLSHLGADRRLVPWVSSLDGESQSLDWLGDGFRARSRLLVNATVVSNWSRQPDADVSRDIATDEVMADIDSV